MGKYCGTVDERMMICLIGAFALIFFEDWNDWQPDADDRSSALLLQRHICAVLGAKFHVVWLVLSPLPRCSYQCVAPTRD